MQICLFISTTAVVALNSLYFKRMLNCYRSSVGGIEQHDYAVFVSVFDILLWAVFMSAVAHVAGARPFSLANFPRRALLRVAAVDQLGTLLASVGATHLAGQVQVLMNQSVLPLTMLLSLLLGRRFTPRQLLGAAIVLAGAISAVQLHGEALSPSQLLFRSLAIFSLAQVAVASATLLKEALLQRPTSTRGDELSEAISLGVAIAWRRVPMGIALALLVPLRVPSQSPGLWADLRDGFLCFCGYQPRFGDWGCPAAAQTTLVSVGLYALQTFLCLRLTQQAGATIRSIAAVTALPLAQLLFAKQGSDGEELGVRSLMGLVLCLSGFAIYTTAEKKEEPLGSRLFELEDRLQRLEQEVSSRRLPKRAAEDEGTRILQAADSLSLVGEQRSRRRALVEKVNSLLDTMPDEEVSPSSRPTS